MGNEHAAVENEELVVDDFNSGFAGKEIRVPASALVEDEPADEPAPGEVTAEVKLVEAAKPDVPVVPPVESAPPVEKPAGRMISEEEYTDLMSLKGDMKKLADTVGGRIGGVERLIQQVQSTTARGEIPKLTAEDMKELSEEFPDMQAAMLPGLNRVLAKLQGTGAPAAAIDMTQVEKLVSERMTAAQTQTRTEVREQVKRELQQEQVATKHSDFATVFASKDFRDYLETLPHSEHEKVLNTWEAGVLIPVLDKYKASKAPPAPPSEKPKPAVSRTEALKAAVNPRSETPPARKQLTDDDMFEEGFNSKD